MNTFLTIFHISPSRQIKIFTKALFSFLLVTSFLASCGPDDLTSTTDSTAPTLTCPADPVALILPAAAENLALTDTLTSITATDNSGDNPILTYEPATVTITTTSVTATATDAAGNAAMCDFAITVTSESSVFAANCLSEPAPLSLPITGDPITLSAASRGVTTTNADGAVTFAYVPESITVADLGNSLPVTATATDAAGNTAMCDFTVTVTGGPPVFAANCPTESVPLSLNIAGDDIPLSEVGSSRVTTANANGEVTLIYDPESITVANRDTSVTVTVTAMDSATSPNTDTCTFTVDVTQNIESSTYRDTTITCDAATPTSAMLDADGTDIDLATLPIMGLTAKDGSTDIPTSTFVYTYTPAILSVVGVQPITVTVVDNDGNVATRNSVEAECMFDFTVIAAPDPSFSSCPMSASAIANEAVTWTMPMLIDYPTGADISAPVIMPDGVTDISSTGATFPAGTYTVTFTAMHNSVAITVGGAPLTCDFAVSVNTIIPPVDPLFVLATNDAAPSAFNPFLIQNADDLSNLATVVNGEILTIDGTNFSNAFSDNGNYNESSYQLMNDINVPPGSTGIGETITPNTSNFTPIGIAVSVKDDSDQLITTCGETCFKGTFDGSNNTISGLRFHHTDSSDDLSTNVGLFGALSGASISNLTLTDIVINGEINVGGLVGIMLDDSSLSHVSAAGSLSANNAFGGLVGAMTDSSMTHVSASVSVAALTTGSVSGGLLGVMDASTITHAFASGSVSGIQSLGGLVGRAVNGSTITHAVATGDVSGVVIFVGGLVGLLEDTSALQYTLAWGHVSGSLIATSLGGLVGRHTSTGTITDSHWDTSTTMQASSSALPNAPSPGDNPDNTNYSGHITSDLRQPIAPGANAGDLYFGWNDTIWNFGTSNEYPVINGLSITLACQRDSSHTSCSL